MQLVGTLWKIHERGGIEIVRQTWHVCALQYRHAVLCSQNMFLIWMDFYNKHVDWYSYLSTLRVVVIFFVPIFCNFWNRTNKKIKNYKYKMSYSPMSNIMIPNNDAHRQEWRWSPRLLRASEHHWHKKPNTVGQSFGGVGTHEQISNHRAVIHLHCPPADN